MAQDAGQVDPAEAAPWNIWMRPEWTGRGPKPSYTLAQIAEAAIAVADVEGLDAVSMRRVAAELGTGAMTLYRYVPNKAQLLELMVDTVFAHDGDLRTTGDWRADIKWLMEGQRVVLLRHPWLGRASAGQVRLGPNMLRGMEIGMAMLDGLGLTIDEMLETFGLLASWVSGFVEAELAQREAYRRFGMDAEAMNTAMAPYVQKVLGEGEHPYFTRVVNEATFRLPEVRFEYALTRILDGIEANLPANRDD